jgi:adenylate cyclase, class 2
MPRNLELKARISSRTETMKTLRKIGEFKQVLYQTDRYFNVRKGRLKLREVLGRGSELIYYKRNEKSGPRWSDYEIVRIKDPKGLRRCLTRALGLRVIVRKKRCLFYYKRIARVHVDSVRGLGNFIELEVISNGKSRDAKLVHDELVKHLRIKRKETIRCSYSDMIMGGLK